MGRYCCVVGCKSRSHDYKGRKISNGIRFFTIPTVKEHLGTQLKELTMRRRLKWVAAIHRTCITFDSSTRSMFVCSHHFHSGEPVYEMLESHPDWAPSLNMGHEVKGSSINRFERQSQREKKQREVRARQATERARQEAEERVRQEAEEIARQEAEEIAQQEAEEKARQEAEEGARQEAEAEDEPSVNDADMEQFMDENESNFCTKRRHEINRLLEENRRLKEELEKRSFHEQFLNDNTKVKYYTGLPSLASFLVILNHLSQLLPKERRVLSPFQMILITFMRLRLNLPRQHIAHLFQVSATTVGTVFTETVNAMFARLGRLVFWPDRDSLRSSMPHQFMEAFGRKVAVIIDCFEVFIERPSNLKARAHAFSNYKHHHTLKFLIGIAPQGTITFISKGWGGRTSDKHLTLNCGFLNSLLPGDVVLADRGFDIKESIGLMCADVKIPAFTKGRAQMDAKDIEETRKLAHLRIHVERVIGNIRNKYEILSSTVPICMILPCENEDLTFFWIK